MRIRKSRKSLIERKYRLKIQILCIAVPCAALVIPVCSAQYQVPPPSPGAPASAGAGITQLDNLLHVTPSASTFRPDDVISVSVYGLNSLGGQLRVERNGTVRFPFVGSVKVEGLTESEFEESLESKLKSAGIVKDPQVIITVISQPWNIVTVSGDVAKPGAFPAQGGLTLIDYLSEAGGLIDNVPSGNFPINAVASSVVTLDRPSLGAAVRIPLGSDPANSPYARIPLLAGDNVRVGRVGLTYAVGAFRFQGAYPLKNTGPTTVLQLMSMAGGIGFEGIRSDAHIIRANGDSHIILDINIDKMLKGQAADYALQPDDILFVPTAQLKAAIKGGGAGALVSIANGLLIYNR
jgi:polysaccharide biosynthesis/export protein